MDMMLKRFILPKDSIVANMEALYAGESMLGGMFGDRYNYKGEQEFLVPRELLIDDFGNTTRQTSFNSSSFRIQ